MKILEGFSFLPLSFVLVGPSEAPASTSRPARAPTPMGQPGLPRLRTIPAPSCDTRVEHGRRFGGWPRGLRTTCDRQPPLGRAQSPKSPEPALKATPWAR